MQLKEKKSSMERDKRKLESELERQRQTISKQAFLQVLGQKKPTEAISPDMRQKVSAMTIPKFQAPEVSLPEPIFNSEPTRDKERTEAPRRQWDKSQKSFMDLENDVPKTKQPVQGSHPTAILTPHYSPTNEPEQKREQKSADTASSRDEMIKTIEVLKSTTVALASKAAATVAANSNNASTKVSGSDSAVKDIDTELSKANTKLVELQNEIARLNLLQQQSHAPTQPSLPSQPTHPTHTTLHEQQITKHMNSRLANDEEPIENDESKTEKETFFISFGSGTAKRDKPAALTHKKNLFVKSMSLLNF